MIFRTLFEKSKMSLISVVAASHKRRRGERGERSKKKNKNKNKNKQTNKQTNNNNNNKNNKHYLLFVVELSVELSNLSTLSTTPTEDFREIRIIGTDLAPDL
jgi:hypothetical protein